VTGTEVAPLEPLFLDDLRGRRQSMLMPSRSTGLAFVLSSGRIVFGRYDNPAGVHEKGGDLRPRLYVGRLAGS
jgi:hypothetical protein